MPVEQGGSAAATGLKEVLSQEIVQPLDTIVRPKDTDTRATSVSFNAAALSRFNGKFALHRSNRA
ncbi:hypothetical protein [Sinorhizobium meliloti]|uniref:hypothetical protein n=1 Tax=Rhizobium meliloti TaxID=382 RepID=UPI0023810B3A|nr:hypothetical protein [Sinorhizobium meliloti]